MTAGIDDHLPAGPRRITAVTVALAQSPPSNELTTR